jgi:hypothetical protein
MQLFGGICLHINVLSVCEYAYVIVFIHTTYSRFTSTTIKKSRFCTLLRDGKYVVELAVASARFMPLGPIVLLMRVFYGKGCFHENPEI